MTCEKVTRPPSQSLSLGRATPRIKMVSNYKSLRLCVSATLNSIPLKEPLVGTLSFLYEPARSNVFSHLVAALLSEPLIQHHWHWNPSSLYVVDSLFTGESKTFPLIMYHIFFARKRHSGAFW